MIEILLAGAMAWQFATERDPLGQPVFVAEIAPGGAQSLRYLCGGITGVVLQFNLGETDFDARQFSTNEPKFEDVEFVFAEGKYRTSAKRAPITDGLATYEIKGSEAAFVAGLLTDSAKLMGDIYYFDPKNQGRVSISRGNTSFSFLLTGADAAISGVKDACPFKYPE
jgi:hypothetical protein